MAAASDLTLGCFSFHLDTRQDECPLAAYESSDFRLGAVRLSLRGVGC